MYSTNNCKYYSCIYAVLEEFLELGKIAEPLLWVIQHFPKYALSRYLCTTYIWLGSIEGTSYSFSTEDQPGLRLSRIERVPPIVSNKTFTMCLQPYHFYSINITSLSKLYSGETSLIKKWYFKINTRARRVWVHQVEETKHRHITEHKTERVL